MADADLYLNEIEIDKYFSEEECKKCGADSCRGLLEKLNQKKIINPEKADLVPEKKKLLNILNEMEKILPRVPMIPMPRPITPGLMEINNPQNGDPILITGNNEFTIEVLITVLASTESPFFLLSADTRGDSLDMAIILNSFNADVVKKTFERENIYNKAPGSTLIIPGRAVNMKDSIKSAVNYNVEIGPVCAVELPLFFRNIW